MAAAVAAFEPFRNTCRHHAEIVEMACFVVFRPFAPRGFRRFLTTTSYAYFSAARRTDISPGNVPRLSARIARRYRVRFSVAVGFRVPSLSSSPRSALRLFVSLRSRLCSTLLSGWHRGFPFALLDGCHHPLRTSSQFANLGPCRAH